MANRKQWIGVHRTLLCLATLVALPTCSRGEIKLPLFFSDGAVLQRDGTAAVWGAASPGEAIDASLEDQTVSTTSDEKGDWSLAFKGLKPGGPFAMTIKGNSDTAVKSNVYVGDVWLCSGQSNMVFTLAQMGSLAKDDVAAAHDPQLRWFMPTNFFVDDPYLNRKWMETSPGNISGVSAVAFYFGRSLREKIKVPIGILEVAFPGSAIEGWLSPQGLENAGIGPESKLLNEQFASLDASTPKFLENLDAWETSYHRQDTGNKGFAQGFADPKKDVSDWKSIPNLADWSSLGLRNGGVVWIRKSIEVPAETAGTDAVLTIGMLRNEGKEFGNLLGTVYFNNHEVGSVGRLLRHSYTSPDPPEVKVPGSFIVPGTNVIAVRFFTQGAKAPFTKTDFVFKSADRKKPVPTITSDCVAQLEAQLPALPADAAASRPATPPSPPKVRLTSFFYDTMLKPVVGYGIRGFIWYQGEANTENFGGAPPSALGNYPPVSYRKLLPALISDWRSLWKQDDLAFYFVQLPNTNTHNKPTGQPERSDWAALRESQLLTWETVPHTGMVVTIDTGTGDLHPPNKKPVGERISLVASANTYGERVNFSGPIYDSMTIEGNKIRLKFKYADSGLAARKEPLREFAIAGADKKFVWADATIDGDTILVSSSDVGAPAAVRYAWLDNPTDCSLYNKAGLPASPFRTDDWPLH